MGDTSETNTKVLSRELFLGVVALKRLYRKIIICATRTLFSGTVTYMYSTYVDFIIIGERVKRVRHPLLLPIEKKIVYIVRTSKPQCACSQFYVKRRNGRACIYEKPACCSRVQLRRARFTYVKMTKRMHIK